MHGNTLTAPTSPLKSLSPIQRGRLTLSRRSGERIHIGEGDSLVIIEVARLSGGNVRLVIDAPRDLRIAREEVLGQTAATPAEPLKLSS